MEVVCLILGPILTSKPCSHAFWVLTSLSFLVKMFFITLYTVIKFQNLVNIMHTSNTNFITKINKDLMLYNIKLCKIN